LKAVLEAKVRLVITKRSTFETSALSETTQPLITAVVAGVIIPAWPASGLQPVDRELI
jgi:hypothetical protein